MKYRVTAELVSWGFARSRQHVARPARPRCVPCGRLRARARCWPSRRARGAGCLARSQRRETGCRRGRSSTRRQKVWPHRSARNNAPATRRRRECRARAGRARPGHARHRAGLPRRARGTRSRPSDARAWRVPSRAPPPRAVRSREKPGCRAASRRARAPPARPARAGSRRCSAAITRFMSLNSAVRSWFVKPGSEGSQRIRPCRCSIT